MGNASWWNSGFDEHIAAVEGLRGKLNEIVAMAEAWELALEKGSKILFFGNGGSAAEALHMAGELVGRLRRPRSPVPAIALSSNTSIVTAIANDDGFDLIFSRQVEALGRPGDVAVGLSTSGGSVNVLQGLRQASVMGLKTILLTGDLNPDASVADLVLSVPSTHVARVQEGHQLIAHMACEWIESRLVARDASAAEATNGPGYFVHPSSYVDDGAEVGEGTSIWHFSHVQSGARIGQKCNLGQSVNVDRGAVLGDNVKVQNNVSIYNGVIVEDDVFLGPSCVFTNVVNPRSHVSRRHEFKPTRVGRGATIGANATVVCGHDIGEFAFVGAGALVSRNVPPYALVVGVPARLSGWMCRCGVKLAVAAVGPSETATCEACGDVYRRDAGSLRAITAP